MADTVNNQHLVSVGICCYNRDEGLKKSLQYITGQTYKNLEIIISQDFNPSMDFSGIAKAENDERVTFYKQPQRLSMYNNFKFLLEKATGSYFMWVSDDDWWAPEFVEKVMEMLNADPLAVAGFTDFIEVDEDNNRIPSYPNHLPLLQEFTMADDITRAKNYINQFEGFGKANLFYSIFKTSALRSPQVLAILENCDLPGDMLINLTVLLKGRLVVVPDILKSCTVGNVKSYAEDAYKPKISNLLIANADFNALVSSYKKWSGFIYYHFTVVAKSNLSFVKKMSVYPTIIKKVLLFYYDLICVNVQLKGYDIFYKIKRERTLN